MAMELQPALILMDLSLPVMDGWEAIRRLKADPETATIPIIALTAHARAEDEIKGSVKGSVLDIVNYPPSFLRRYKRWFK